MTTPTTTWLASTDWLAANLSDLNIVLLDGSMHLPTSGRNAKAEFATAHIPGAQYFDIDAIADKTHPMPHMLPPPAQFAEQVGAMGISNASRVVVYDSEGLYSAGRVWWMFRAMGHDDVAVLDGGLKKWKAEGRPLTEAMTPARARQSFTPAHRPHLARNRDDVKALIGSPNVQIVDARAAARFEGSVPEPRAGLRSGHIPSSRNVPFTTLLEPDGTLKAPDALRSVFAASGVDPARPVVASCGSGVTAGVVAFALARLGHPDTAVYDGSWTEWGSDPSLPLETGKR
jgi:thiosulfate/3-mercaptopyruvate sulfurtransferase